MLESENKKSQENIELLTRKIETQRATIETLKGALKIHLPLHSARAILTNTIQAKLTT